MVLLVLGAGAKSAATAGLTAERVATRPASAVTGSFCTSSVASWLLCSKCKEEGVDYKQQVSKETCLLSPGMLDAHAAAAACWIQLLVPLHLPG
jgi:hypothetical protein